MSKGAIPVHMPQLLPITKLQRNYSAIIRQLPTGPVFLSQHAKPVAVVLSPADYERLAGAEKEMHRLRRIVAIDAQFAAMDAGDFTVLTPDKPVAYANSPQ
jgi:prevent-host-death family protein